MRVWDIVDQFDTGPQITEKPRVRSRLNGFVASAAKVAVAVGFVVASSGHFYVPTTSVFSSSAAIKVPIARLAVVEQPSPPRRLRTPTATDTQFGQSTAKLARNFARFFQPATDEEQVDEYSF